MVRYGPRAGLLGAAQGRIAELWAAAGCQLSAFAPAPAPEPEAKALRLSVLGLALVGVQQVSGGASVKRTREAVSHPFGPMLGCKPGEMEAEACVKRRKYEANPAASGPVNQGLLQGSTATKAESRVVRRGTCALLLWGRLCCLASEARAAPLGRSRVRWMVARGKRLKGLWSRPTPLCSFRGWERLSVRWTDYG